MAKEGGVKTMRKFKDIEISYAEKKREEKKGKKTKKEAKEIPEIK